MQQGDEARAKGNWAAALNIYTQGLRMTRNDVEAAAYQHWCAVCEYYLGKNHAALGDFKETIQHIDLLKDFKFPYEYEAHYWLVATYINLEQWVNALSELDILFNTKYTKDKADSYHYCLSLRADALRGKGDFEEARKCYNVVQEYFAKQQNQGFVIATYCDLAEVLLLEGKAKETVDFIQSVWQKVQETEGTLDECARLAITLGKAVLYNLERSVPGTAVMFENIEPLMKKQLVQLENSEKYASRLSLLAVLSQISDILGKREIFGKTEAFLQEIGTKENMEAMVSSVPSLKSRIQLTINLGNYYYQQISKPGPTPLNFKTLELYRKADALIDKTATQLWSMTTRQNFYTQYMDLPYRIFGLFQTIYQDYWEDFLYECLGTLEKYKGYSLSLSQALDLNAKKRVVELNTLAYQIGIKAKYQKVESDPAKKAKLRQEQDELEKQYSDLETDAIINGSFNISVKTEPVQLMNETLKEIWPVLDHFKYGILYFALNENVLYIIAFTKGDIHRSVVKLDKPKFEKAQKLLKTLREVVASASGQDEILKVHKILDWLSKWASKEIMQPELVQILEKLEYLTIIPSGFFINFPLEVLMINNEYLGTRFKLSREFNLKLLAKQMEQVRYLKRNGKNFDHISSPLDVVFMSNPNSGECMVPAKSLVDPFLVRRDRIVQTPGELQSRSGAKEESFLESDCAEMDLGTTEIDEIIPKFLEAKIPFSALKNEQVSREEFLKLVTQDLKIFHFAGHALFDDDYPQFSKLLLRGGDLIVPHDFQKSEFRQNPLIIFSACESGVSEVQKGDEPFGFLRILKSVQAQNIIFSLWPVLSVPTTFMMITFYQRLFQGDEITEALRYARSKLLEKIKLGEAGMEAYKDIPLLCWTPFSFVGLPFVFYKFLQVGQK